MLISAGLCDHEICIRNNRFIRRKTVIPIQPTRHTTRVLIAILFVALAPIIVTLTPLALCVAAVIDITTDRSRMAKTRLVAMAVSYVVLESIGILAAFGLWIATGFGLALDRPWSQRAHARVQGWWGHAIFASAHLWLRVRMQVENEGALNDRPIIIASHHASFFDALLPTELLHNSPDTFTRHVLKRQLAWDPCLGIYGHRRPNHFVERASATPSNERHQIESLAATADAHEALVIFPEGTFRSAVNFPRTMKRFTRTDPDRADRLDLTHTLPPKPGGLLALMRGAPHADIVFIGHVGFAAFGSLRDIAANVPFTDPVRVRMWRVPRAAFGNDPHKQLLEIDRRWQELDDWIETQISG
jgi:1-acyl-sn-glycerol-3-phosphate acyltransferase